MPTQGSVLSMKDGDQWRCPRQLTLQSWGTARSAVCSPSNWASVDTGSPSSRSRVGSIRSHEPPTSTMRSRESCSQLERVRTTCRTPSSPITTSTSGAVQMGLCCLSSTGRAPGHPDGTSATSFTSLTSSNSWTGGLQHFPVSRCSAVNGRGSHRSRRCYRRTCRGRGW